MSNIMFRIPQKKTTSVDLYGPFRSYIASQYSEEEAWNHENDLQTLKKLRSDVEDPAKQRSPPGDRLNLLQFYFRVLCVIEIVFPISSAEDQVDVTFTWYDAFEEEQKRNFFRKGRQIQKASQQNIHLEKAAVLFNLGAVYSQIGQSCDRSTLKGRKVAQRAFESAAGAFAYLKENAAPKASEGGDSITVDVSVECADMLEKLMLAQAQECALENANAKESSWGAQAKIARQAAMYCEDALAALSKPILIRHVPKHWKRRVQLKAAFFNAEACWKRGSELYKEREVGEAIARLTSGINTLKKAKKSTEGAPSQLLDTIKNLKQNISSELGKAVKTNKVFGERVPLLDSLTPLPSFSMVKPMGMNDILDAGKEKIFASLVQVESAKERSRYTEMVDEIIRTQAEKSGQLEDDIRGKLEDMGLPGSIEALEERFTVPADLEQELEESRSIGGRAGLEAKLQNLLDRDRSGTRGARSKSSTLKKDVQDGENGFAADLRRATKSYADIKRSVNNHSALMSILDHPPIESAFPILGALKKSLKQLHAPGSQSARLQEELKVMNGKDDVLPKGIQEDLFRKKIGEYKRTSEENMKAKAQLLLKIQEQNDQFSSDLEDYEASCQKCYKQIRAAIAKYREIKEKIDDALKPYIDLQDSVTNKKQQCDKFVMTRNNQHRETIGSETDVYGQAASSSVAAANWEEAIRQIWDIGEGRWDMDTVVLALDAAGNDRERAVNYLLSGTPEQAEVPPATRVPPGARAVPPARPAQFAPGQLASTMPQGVTVLPKEREAIERLEAMGYDRARVLEAYIACNKNEEQAANLLLDEVED